MHLRSEVTVRSVCLGWRRWSVSLREYLAGTILTIGWDRVGVHCRREDLCYACSEYGGDCAFWWERPLGRMSRVVAVNQDDRRGGLPFGRRGFPPRKKV